jgi:RNAse (barnase) inhibitor barstar
MRVGTALNSWGEPIHEEIKTPVEVTPQYLIEEQKSIEESTAKLNAIYFRLNKIHHKTLDERVSVDLVGTEQSGESKFEIKVHAGHLSRFVEDMRKESFEEATDQEDFESVFQDKLSLFGSEDFRKKLEDELWDSLRHTGNYSGIKVEVVDYPKTEPEFKDSQFTVEMLLAYDEPALDQQAIERAISGAIESMI